jgi:hypothetical protein
MSPGRGQSNAEKTKTLRGNSSLAEEMINFSKGRFLLREGVEQFLFTLELGATQN